VRHELDIALFAAPARSCRLRDRLLIMVHARLVARFLRTCVSGVAGTRNQYELERNGPCVRTVDGGCRWRGSGESGPRWEASEAVEQRFPGACQSSVAVKRDGACLVRLGRARSRWQYICSRFH
jgi:hypothetical protein